MIENLLSNKCYLTDHRWNRHFSSEKNISDKRKVISWIDKKKSEKNQWVRKEKGEKRKNETICSPAHWSLSHDQSERNGDYFQMNSEFILVNWRQFKWGKRFENTVNNQQSVNKILIKCEMRNRKSFLSIFRKYRIFWIWNIFSLKFGQNFVTIQLRYPVKITFNCYSVSCWNQALIRENFYFKHFLLEFLQLATHCWNRWTQLFTDILRQKNTNSRKKQIYWRSMTSKDKSSKKFMQNVSEPVK